MDIKFSKVLLVDDDKINNFLTGEIISSLNIAEEVIILTDGQQTLDYLIDLDKSEFSEAENALILLDLNMPVMDGFEFLEEFGKKHLKGKYEIVVLTSSDNQRDKEKIEKLKVEKLISKPITGGKNISSIKIGL